MLAIPVALSGMLGGALHAQAATTRFVLSGSTSVTAGSPFNLSVIAVTSGGQVDPNYTGSVHFTSTDPNHSTTLPSDYTFTSNSSCSGASPSADCGSHTFIGLKLDTSGSQTITATDTVTATVTGSLTYTVSPGALAKLDFSAPANVATGVPFTTTVTAQDALGNTETAYAGTVTFSSSDHTATLPPNRTFSPSDKGTHTFTNAITLNVLGNQTVTVADVANNAITTADGVIVSGPATSLTVSFTSAPGCATSSATTHVAFPCAQITATDVNSNAAVSYRGTVHFTSSTDGTATLPADYSFTSGDAGIHTFSVTYDMIGSQSLTATDTSISSIAGTGNTTVHPGPAAHFVLTVPGTVSFKAAFTVTVTAEDFFGDVATGYTGTAAISSPSDATAIFSPTSYAFTAADAGVKNFSATLDSTGSQTIHAVDTVNSGISGNGTTTVSAGGPAQSVHLDVPAAASSGQAFSIRVSAVDGAGGTGKTSTAYRGSVHFTSTDVLATLPADYAFTAADNGVHVFTVTLNQTGSYTISATDTVTASITGTSTAVPVAGLVAAGGGYTVTVVPSSAVAGSPVHVTVVVHDSSGRTATNYTGTVTFSSTDTHAVLPSNYTFTTGDCGVAGPGNLDCGAHTFSVTFHTAGSWTVTATDATTGTITGMAPVTVTAGPAAQLLFVSPPATATAGTPFSLTVEAEDSSGNRATTYRGAVTFTSSDNAATLPTDYTFTGGDTGRHTFGATLASAGSRTITVTDTVSSAMTAFATIAVSPGAASAYVLTAPQHVSAGSAFSFRVGVTDAFGNRVFVYTGTSHFTSTDLAAALPADYTFVSGDQGTHTFSATLNTPRQAAQAVTATDTTTSSITGAADILTSGSASSLAFSPSSSATTAGTPSALTVTAYDPFGNIAIGYAGTVHFTSTDAQAALPGDYAFTSDSTCDGLTSTADCGSHTFSVTLQTAGSQTVTATDAPNHLQAGATVQVAAGPATSLAASAPSSSTAGQVISVLISASDAYGNAAAGYRGTVHFTSSDAQAVLPGDYAFTAGDAGSHSFSVTLNTTGVQTVTAQDTVKPSLIAASGTNVTPGSAARITVTAPASAGSGQAFSATVTAYDAESNVATGYAGTVHFTSSDPQATLPADYTFVGGDNGAHMFSVTMVTSGEQTLTATDAGNSFTGGAAVQVDAGAAAHLGLVAPGFATAGYASSVTVTATDSHGNVASGYTGTVHFTSSDPQAALPADYTFVPADAGSHAFTVTLSTPGSQSVTVTDTLTSGLTATSSLTVNATPRAPDAPTNVVAVSNAPGHLTVTWTPPANQGSSPISGYTIVVYDANRSVVSTTPVASSPATIAGLTNGKPYYVTVAAVNNVGSSAAVASYSATPSAGGTPPARTTVASSTQYVLPNSDGVAWQRLDESNLSLSLAPGTSEDLILSANADLWTSAAGYNQDIGIAVSVNGGPQTISAWKESGGSAGTFSPNAAFVQTVYHVTSGNTYSFFIVWKTNRPALGASIAVGAGSGSPFSPTRINAQVLTGANADASAVSTQQYTLQNSDGMAWVAIDPTKLKVALNPGVTEDVVLSANADLWTFNAGFNQDLAISISSDGGSTWQVLAWKESGGFAGTFSPNAAYVQTVAHLTGGTSYLAELFWKANTNAPGATIAAGAGPINTVFSPTSLNAYVVQGVSGADWATAVSTQQYTLASSDGVAWQPMDSANLGVTGFTPASSGNVLVSAGADLWTANAGYNQDIGIEVSTDGGTTWSSPIAWKESGGFAGTFSPNAAFVQTNYAVTGGTTYAFRVVWKTNKPATGATIYAAAGPIASAYSPTRLTIVPA